MLWIPNKAYVDQHVVITFANELKPVYIFLYKRTFKSLTKIHAFKLKMDSQPKKGEIKTEE